jgi:hypothetical protein
LAGKRAKISTAEAFVAARGRIIRCLSNERRPADGGAPACVAAATGLKKIDMSRTHGARRLGLC